MIGIYSIPMTFKELLLYIAMFGGLLWLVIICTRAEDTIKRKKFAILEDEYRKRFENRIRQTIDYETTHLAF